MSDTDKILSGHVYQAVKELLQRFPGNYLEIGVFNGIGTAEIGRSYPNKIIYAVDPFIEDGYTSDASKVQTGESMISQREACHQNIANLDNIVLFETTSKAFAEMLTDEMVKDMDISWVTIDGSHHYADVKIDYNLAVRLINGKPGIILFDDMAHPGVRDAYNEFVEQCSSIISSEHILIGDNVARVVRINIPNE